MKLIKIFIFFCMFLILFTNVLSIGITPGKYTINFYPDYQENVKYTIVNNEHKDMDVLLTLEGDLSNSIILHNKIVPISSTEEFVNLNYDVKLPAKIDKPGIHEFRLTALDLPKNYNKEGSFVGATTAVVSLIQVRVPYPGKYIEGKLSIEEKDGKLRFLIPITNLGKEDVYLTNAVVDVYGPTNEKLFTLKSDQRGIKSFEKTELVAELGNNLNSGKYYAVANVNYDGEILKLESIFEAGESRLNIVDISVRNFKLGEIAKVSVLVESNWNKPIEEIYSSLIVRRENGDFITSVKSATMDIDPLSQKQFDLFWDTAGVKEGTYDAEVSVNYDEKSIKNNLKAFVSLKNLKFEGFGGTGQVIRDAGPGKSVYLGILVVILIIINVLWFFYFRKKNNQT